MIAIDAWKLFVEHYKQEKELERKRKQYIKLTKQTLDYPLLESIIKAAAAQNPGFYSTITFTDGTKLELGVKAKSAGRQDGGTF